MKRLQLLIIFILGIFSTVYAQKTIYVNANIGNDTNSGLTWAQAYKSLNIALNAASSGDQIWVSRGTYYIGNPYDAGDPNYKDKAFILKDGVSVYGGFWGNETSLAQRNWKASPSILSAWAGTGNQADNYYHVVIAAGIGNGRLDGFIVERGNANGTGSILVNSISVERDKGGGIYCSSTTNFKFANLIVRNNHAGVLNNSTGSGGGIYLTQSSTTLENTQLIKNQASNGGAIATVDDNLLTMVNTLAAENEGVLGGAIYVSNTYCTLTNCTVAANTARNKGGGMYFTASSMFEAYNDIFANNTAVAVGNDICNDDIASYASTNTLITDANMGPEQFDGLNIIVSNPQFTNPGEYFLKPISPAVNTGDNAAISGYLKDLNGDTRIKDGTVDLGAYEVQCTAIPTTEFTELETVICANTIPNLLTITYDSMGGSSVASTQYYENEMATIAAAPTKPGYVFTEWNTTADGSGTSYAPGTNFTMPGHDIVLYAIFNLPVQHTVTYDTQGGSYVAPSQYYAGDLAMQPAAPTKSGYVFTEWNTTPDGSGVSYTEYESFIMPDYDFTIYAMWAIREEYKVDFDSMGGSYVPSINTYAGEIVTLYDSPTRPGYAFTGWNTNMDGSGMLYLPGDSFVMLPQNITLYAMFIEDFRRLSRPTISINVGPSGTPPFQVTYESFVNNISQGTSKWIDINSTGVVDVPINLTETTTYKLISITDANGCSSTSFTGNSTITVNVVNGNVSGNGTLYVNNSVLTSGDGSSWDNAFKELADALYYTQHCGIGTVKEVWVAQGTYSPLYAPVAIEGGGNPVTEREATFYLPDKVKIYGGFLGYETSVNQRNWRTNTTILSGDIGFQGDNSDNCYHVVTAIDLTNTVLDGFTIEGGNADGAGWITVNGHNIWQHDGGGIYEYNNGTIRFENLNIIYNYAIFGAGINTRYSAAVYEKLTITDNYAMNAGAIYANAGTTIMANSLVARNMADQNGGGLYYDGDNGYLINSTVVDNACGLEGSGLWHIAGSNLKIQNSIIWDNNYAGNTVGLNSAFPTFDFSIVDGYIGHDPMFMNPWSGDYHLQPFSDGVNGGEAYLYYASGLLGNTDLDENPRMLGSRIDIGAYETECKLVAEAVFVENKATICEGQPLTLDINILDHGMGFLPPYFITYTPDNGYTYMDTPPIWDQNTTITVYPTSSTSVRLEYIRNDRDCMQHLYMDNTVDVTVLKASPSAGILYVDINAAAGGDGSSWNSAIKELADALQFVRTCGSGTVEEIHVAGGTYYPLYHAASKDISGNATTDRSKSFVIPKNLKLFGSYRGGSTSPNDRDTAIYRTILSGDLQKNDLAGKLKTNKDDNAYHVVIAAAQDGAITIDGFTIVGGNASDYNDIKVENLDIPDNRGGGLYVISDGSANISLSNNNFYGNNAIEGGGTYLGTTGASSVVTLSASHLNKNIGDNLGGGIYAQPQAGSITINGINCSNNTAQSGAGLYAAPDAILLIENSNISKNTANSLGGGVHMYTSPQSNVTIKKCHINHNQAYQGGGINIMTTSTTDLSLVNNIIANNSSTDAGGGLYLNTFSSTTATNILLTNNSIINNTAGSAKGFHLYAGASPNVEITANNNVIWNNDTNTNSGIDIQSGSSNKLVFNHNLIEGKSQTDLTQAPFDATGIGNLDGTTSNSNATISKLFASYTNENYRLTLRSIASNSGDNSYTNAVSVTTDLDNLPRIIGGTVDLGAYEYLWGGLSLTNDTVMYDGSEHLFSKPINGLSELSGYATAIVTNQGKGTNAGMYQHVVDMHMTQTPKVYPDIPLSAYLVILPAEFTGLTFNDYTTTYDGTVKSIYVNNLPSGATVSYINNDKINVGVYTVEAIVSKPNYRDTSLFATLTIEPGVFSGLVFNDLTVTYDGTPKSIYVQGAPSGTTIDYIDNGQTDVGMYTVIATLSKPNYRDTTIMANLTILPVGTDMYFPNWTTVYDGTSKSIYVQNLPPDNTGVTYTNNAQTNVGVYTVTAVVHRPGGDETLTATLTIEPALLTGMVLNDWTTMYDGTVKSLVVTYQRSGITIVYDNNDQTEVGVYPVKATITKPNYRPLELHATLTITPATLTGMVLNDLTVVYDGTPKSIYVTYERSGITIDYQGNSKIEVGVYPVRAIVSKQNHYDLVLDATLTILPATFINVDFNDGTFYYDGTPKSIYVSGEPSGTTVSYTGNDQVNVGVYPVSAELSNPNYNNLTLSATLTIMYDLLEGLYIDGEEHDINLVYDTKCVDRDLRINLVLKPGATASIPISFTVRVEKPGILEIPFTVTSDDGARTKDFVLRIEKRYPFDDIIDQKVNNVFMLDLKKLREDGWSFKTYNWYRNGQLIHTGTYYSAGNSRSDLLDNTASYYAELIDANGTVLKTCEKIPVFTKVEMKAYPVPVKRGSTFTVQIITNEPTILDSYIEVYNMMGSKVGSVKVAGVSTMVTAPSNAGVYIIRLVNSAISESIKIVVE